MGDVALDDVALVGPYMQVGYLLLRQASDPAAYSRHVAEQWATIARLQKHEQDKKRLDWRRTPSGMLKTQTPPAPRPDAVDAELDRIDGSYEHRTTPLVPDPRKEDP